MIIIIYLTHCLNIQTILNFSLRIKSNSKKGVVFPTDNQQTLKLLLNTREDVWRVIVSSSISHSNTSEKWRYRVIFYSSEFEYGNFDYVYRVNSVQDLLMGRVSLTPLRSSKVLQIFINNCIPLIF